MHLLCLLFTLQFPLFFLSIFYLQIAVINTPPIRLYLCFCDTLKLPEIEIFTQLKHKLGLTQREIILQLIKSHLLESVCV